MAVGVYPGSFDPPTVAHLAIAEAAWRQASLDRVDLVISRRPLGKPAPLAPALADRLRALEAVAASRPWLAVTVTDARLLVDIARGYDVLVVGADKWSQVVDPAWYGGSVPARDDALARLPRVLVVPRPPFPAPAAELLAIEDHLLAVSSSGARLGREDWIAPEAGAVVDPPPPRYAAWRQASGDNPPGSLTSMGDDGVRPG